MTRRDGEYLQWAGWAIAAIVTVHGITSRRWRELHTVGVVVSALAVVGPRLPR